MSFHILHILTHGTRITKDRGRLWAHYPDNRSRSIPIEDLRGVVLAARGIAISPDAIAAVLEAGAFILHCDAAYRPCGITMPMARLSKDDLASAQLHSTRRLQESLWRCIIQAKIKGQSEVLKKADVLGQPLHPLLLRPNPDESTAARIYWKHLFKKLDNQGFTRSDRKCGPINQLLNYGYAVMGSLIHRSVVISGMLPIFGIHHRSRYRSTPLVFDLIEPLRPHVDASIIRLVSEASGQDLAHEDALPRELAKTLKSVRIRTSFGSLALIDAVDGYVRSVGKCFLKGSTEPIWIPAYSCDLVCSPEDSLAG